MLLRPYEKPFLPVPQQIEQLRARGLEIGDAVKAARYLEQIGYYRFSGYFYPMRASKIVIGSDGRPTSKIEDAFRQGAAFEAVLGLYVFDRKLRVVMLDVLERIEVLLRTQVALQLGQYSRWAHREPRWLAKRYLEANTDGRSQYEKFIDKLNAAESRSKEDFVKHFNQEYSDPIPIWATVELWDFGMLSSFVSGLKGRDANAIAENLNIPSDAHLRNWVWVLSFIRNICAHHARLWNRTLVPQPKLPKEGQVPSMDHLIGDELAKGRFYSAATITRHIQRQINPSSNWHKRFKEAVSSFPSGSGIAIGQAGFPDDWANLDIWN